MHNEKRELLTIVLIVVLDEKRARYSDWAVYNEKRELLTIVLIVVLD